MRKLSMVALSLVLLLTACAPNFQKQEEVVQKKDDDTKEKAIIPKYKISEKYYRTIMPFEPGEARGMVVNNLNTRYDITEFETGLMRIAQNSFPTDKYVFKEGQYLDGGTVSAWLEREMTPAQVKAKEEELQAKAKKEKSNKKVTVKNLGLNPIDTGKGDVHKRNEKNPIYLAHIIEHDYLVQSGKKDTYQLGGIAIGLALNSVHYYREEAFGAVFEKNIPRSVLEAEGKKIAKQVVSRLRNIDELKNVPITVGLFEQESRSSVVPGNFFAYTEVSQGSNDIGSWKDVKEEYILFPSGKAEKEHRDDLTFFENFKQDVEEYFPNFNGVIGKGFYVDGQLQELNIEIPIQFYGKAEAIGFTQYVTGLVMEHFPNYISVQVSVSSVLGQEALIVKKPDQDEPFVHIYE
ncbi:CamS family sex pheromone protein [Mesobacillus sp. AQ2]|uniref:CamS family sex pheromone protein n=1 Tax=Bacillaceae TaxID=186817 RepID=UPI00119D02F1|nr:MULTISPECIES: CamS family sex pheromone protein [Bacillaceae]MCM3125161.1 CamS family sex pheromone protein [Mesobacillus sp. MER 33]MCM3235408.1 CamS family sex pheromone protein [Mesobacillus sp. MER 48]WHX40918.1 CamS family sex pheromone protein [Mesobacillus sp. AQ2]